MKKKKLTSLDILDGTVGSSAALSRTEMKQIMAGSGGCWKCCWDHNPSSCSVCVDYCSGSNCNCAQGSSPVSCCDIT